MIVSVYCAWSCACLFCMYNLVFNVHGENGGHTKHWESDKHVGSNSFQKISKAKVHFRRLYLCPTIFTWLSLLVRNFLLYINQYMVSTPFYKARSTTSELPLWIACPNCMLYMSKFSEIYASFSSSSLFFLPSFLLLRFLQGWSLYGRGSMSHQWPEVDKTGRKNTNTTNIKSYLEGWWCIPVQKPKERKKTILRHFVISIGYAHMAYFHHTNLVFSFYILSLDNYEGC